MSNPIDMPISDEDIFSDVSYYWSFYPIRWTESDTFKDKSRSITRILKNDFGDTEYEVINISEATSSDYSELVSSKPYYFKIEISNSASSTKTNFYDNSLVGSFYIPKSGGYFEIIGQEGGNIIDVSISDITKTKLLNPASQNEYTILQDFGWKFNQWEMIEDNQVTESFSDAGNRSTQRVTFFNGEIIATNKKNNMILLKVVGENQATKSKEGYYNLGSRESISFYQRYVEQYAHKSGNPRKVYKKYRGWHTYSTNSSYSGSVNNYKIKNISIETEKKDFNDKDNYELIIEFEEEPTNFFVGDIVYTIFDKTPYQKQGVFNGSQLIQVAQIPGVRGDTNNRACLDGFWLSARYRLPIPNGTRFGLCGGRYWGLGDRARDNNNAIVFMRTPRSGLGISSMFHSLSNISHVCFYDYFTNELSIRSGNLTYSEHPNKFSVSVGLPAKTEYISPKSASSSKAEIPLDNTQGMTKAFSFEEYPKGDGVILFSIKSEEEYYGTVIGGEGEMDLLGFKRSSIKLEKEEYTYKGEIVSPVYEYALGANSLYEERDINISIDTSDSPLILSGSADFSSISAVKIQYVDDNQIINDSNLIELIKTDYDEFLIIMGKSFPSFTVDSSTKASNSLTETNRWNFSEGIFMIGSRNLGSYWGLPRNNLFDDKSNEYGLLVLDNAKHLCSLYMSVNNNIAIFFVSSIGKQVYLGALIINNDMIDYELLYCKSDSGYRDFWWRPPLLDKKDYMPSIEAPPPSSSPSGPSSASSTDTFSTSTSYKLKDGDVPDDLIIIASESITSAQIKASNVTDFGNVSCYYMKDGRIILLYDSLSGINMLFSSASGLSWGKSEIILQRSATSGVYLEPWLFFISPSGIYVKLMTSSTILQCALAVEGEPESFIKSVQKGVDDFSVVSLNTGSVPSQKFSAKYTDTGFIQVFYYDSEGKLSSSVGDGENWVISRNF